MPHNTTMSDDATAMALLEQARMLMAQHKRQQASSGLAALERLPAQKEAARKKTLVGNNMKQMLVLTRKWERFVRLCVAAGRTVTTMDVLMALKKQGRRNCRFQSETGARASCYVSAGRTSTAVGVNTDCRSMQSVLAARARR